ncbi:KAP family P-loop domain protein [Corynebacterium hansenii]|nr:KAP family P-loop domain protein [Corynebacterium hansenii]
MTIAIQGGWGSGKSTILKLIEDELKNSTTGHSIKTETIETWPLAHTNSEEDIPAAFVAEVFDRMTSDSKEKKENRKKIFKTISPSFRRTLTNIAGSFMGPAGNMVSAGINEALDAITQNGTSRSEAQEIQEEFKQDVAQLLRDPNTNEIPEGSRLVIFVDDLDRLPPARAVQIMETLKLFINSRHCIFVLAIDFDVVADGTRAIYGDSMRQDKARMFFHKIIQVPFNVPSPGKEVESYLKEIRKDWPDNTDLSPWAEVAMGALDSNPRAIKRVFNAMSLLKLIRAEQGHNEVGQERKEADRDEFFDFCLFTILCIQNVDDMLASQLIEDILEHESYRDFVTLETDEQALESTQDADWEADDTKQADSPEGDAPDLWNRPVGHSRFTSAELLKKHPMTSSIFELVDDATDANEGSSSSKNDASEETLKAAARLCSLTSLVHTPSSKKRSSRPPAGIDSARGHFLSHFTPKKGEWSTTIFDAVAEAFNRAELDRSIIVRASSNERLFFDLSPELPLPKDARRKSRRLADLRFTSTGRFTPYINIPDLEYKSVDSLNEEFSHSQNSALKETFALLSTIDEKKDGESWSGDARIIPARNKGIGTGYQLAQVKNVETAKNFAAFMVEHFKDTLEKCAVDGVE